MRWELCGMCRAKTPAEGLTVSLGLRQVGVCKECHEAAAPAGKRCQDVWSGCELGANGWPGKPWQCKHLCKSHRQKLKEEEDLKDPNGPRVMSEAERAEILQEAKDKAQKHWQELTDKVQAVVKERDKRPNFGRILRGK